MAICLRIVKEFSPHGSKVTVVPVFTCAHCKRAVNDLNDATLRTPQSRHYVVGDDCDILVLHKGCADSFEVSHALPFKETVDEVMENIDTIFIRKKKRLDLDRNALYPADWNADQRHAAIRGQPV
jgi:hypothetical protein